MARPQRIHVPGSWYHVTNRGADRQDLFSNDDDHLYFQALLGDSHERHSIEFHAFCAMTTHFHLLMRVPTTDFSASLQHLTGTYAAHYNRTYGRTGPVFDGRFHSVLIENDRQLVATARYIHRNPLSFVPLHALASYRWSSYPALLGRASAPGWLTTDRSLVLQDMDRDAYRAFVETPLASDSTPEHGGSGRRYTVDQVLDAVADAAGVDTPGLLTGRRGSLNQPRLLAIQMAVELRGPTVADIADYFGFAGNSGVRNAARRARVLEASDPSFASLRRRASNLLHGAA